MLRKQFVTLLAGLALLVAVTGTPGIVADSFGLAVTPQAHACQGSGNAGGGC